MAASVVGGSFLSAFLQVLFDRMASPEFLNLFRTQKAYDNLLRKLERKLDAVKAVLDDAENKEIRSPSIKKWLEKLHDTFYQADDLLDRINTEALRIKVETEYQSSSNTRTTASKRLFFERILPFTSSSNKFLRRIIPEIETIVETLEGCIQQIPSLGLQVVHSKRQSHQQFETPLVDDTSTFGRKADKEKVIQMLLSVDANGDNVTVVPIVGLGGLGKTTLARMVYNDLMVEEGFPTRAWVCISEEYNATRVTKELLRELKISFSDDENLFSLQGKLQIGLTDKRFLLVLDDVWNEDYNHWDNLRIPFKGGLPGSKIIVTTRNLCIARMMGKEESIHNLDTISEEDCWSLFEKHTFENRNDHQNPKLEEIGRKIVKKCGGLPLAVKTVAGILRCRTTLEEWEEILTSEEWTRTDNPNGPIPALRLSYIHLPSQLKRCFAYCAVFHKDYQFRKEEIIQLWQANDLLGYNEGEKCFHELRLRSLFHQSTNDTFSMHDLVNDLARCVFGKYCLRLEDHAEGDAAISGARHFSYHPSFYDTFRKFNLLKGTKNIRTFLPLRMERDWDSMYRLSNKFSEDILPQFMFLRILSLNHYNVVKLPNSWSCLKQLRFLDLSSTEIKELPEWICSFYNLQTLLLSQCRKLEELPTNLGKLINLCRLDICETPLKKMPPQMGRLINLRVLTAFVIGKDSGSTIEELEKLPMLCGELFLSGLENVSSGRGAFAANMGGKKNLEKLTLKWNEATNDSQVARDVLGNLRPHSSIKHLKIIGYGGTTFPNWLGNPSLSHLESLSLHSCEYCFSLPALGQLESLQSLDIIGMSCISVFTEDFYGDSSVIKPFPSLKKLRIEKLPEWEKWHIPDYEVFNRLEDLSIINCPKLIGELPQQLSSLQGLEISGCDNLVLSNGQLSIFNGEIQQKFSSLRRLNISRLQNLIELPLQLNQLSRLEKLKVDDCGSLSPSHVCRPPASLKSLKYGGCCNLELESDGWEGGGTLEYLELYNCDSIKVKAEWLASFPMLKDLKIENCKRIAMLSTTPTAPEIGNQSSTTTTTTTTMMTSLQSLWINDCDDQMSFPEGGLAARNLTQIIIFFCKKLKSLPKQMESLLPSLQRLILYHCPEIECFPEGGLPSSLQFLSIYQCKRLMNCRREWGLEKLPSLTSLAISGPYDEVESFPEEDWLLPSTLEYLSLLHFDNLKVLNYSGLRHLTSLQNLDIIGCPRLQSLPQEGLPASLTTLSIIRCPLLEPRLELEKGQDWPKVAHIPCVAVDREPIP